MAGTHRTAASWQGVAAPRAEAEPHPGCTLKVEEEASVNQTGRNQDLEEEGGAWAEEAGDKDTVWTL